MLLLSLSVLVGAPGKEDVNNGVEVLDISNAELVRDILAAAESSRVGANCRRLLMCKVLRTQERKVSETVLSDKREGFNTFSRRPQRRAVEYLHND